MRRGSLRPRGKRERREKTQGTIRGKDGSIAAGERLKSLVDDGLTSASTTYDIALEAFGSGKAPFLITGPWSVPQAKEKLGDDFMVCPIPNWEGSEYVSTSCRATTFHRPS